jgi:hypothetical protein
LKNSNSARRPSAKVVAGWKPRSLRARRYSWDAVTDEYEQLLLAVREAHDPGRLPPELVDLAPR